ncbi:MAG TPA: hypothetical protein DEA85_02870 [Firmicutes bacterium]|jgi:RNA polymerase sigma-70 factor (ECF subfamily)|nr:hypothetical protein [Bacillota bacterium]HBS92939.1 hypothetical protein [Bacillota bacterium]
METLIAKAKAGDREAFAKIVREKQRLVLHLAAGYLGWRDAEDAAQVIWTVVWRKLWQVEDPHRFDQWLKTLVFHHCLNLRKARARYRNREAQLAPESWLSLAECVAADSCTLEDLLVSRELRSLLSRELDALPGDYGLLLRMHYCNDLNYRQIAELSGLPQSTLKWRLHQGRALLKSSLAKHFAYLDIRR